MSSISRHIQEQISSLYNEKKAKWLENYVKHNIKSKGVGIPQIRTIIKATNQSHQLQSLTIEDQLIFLNDLMSQVYTEDKLAAILYLQLFWKKAEAPLVLSTVENWLDQHWINDWNVCDWMCVRILSPLVDEHPSETVAVLASWNKAPYLWKARTSLVPFAQSKGITNHKAIIYTLCEGLIKREERFCKTAVGWALREFSKHDEQFVIDFLEKFQEWTSKEVIRNARKYIDK